MMPFRYFLLGFGLLAEISFKSKGGVLTLSGVAKSLIVPMRAETYSLLFYIFVSLFLQLELGF